MVTAGEGSIFRSMAFNVQRWGWTSTLSTCRQAGSSRPARLGNSVGVVRTIPIALASSMKADSGSSEVLVDPDPHMEELRSLFAAPGFGLHGEVFNAVRKVKETVSVAR